LIQLAFAPDPLGSGTAVSYAGKTGTSYHHIAWDLARDTDAVIDRALQVAYYNRLQFGNVPRPRPGLGDFDGRWTPESFELVVGMLGELPAFDKQELAALIECEHVRAKKARGVSSTPASPEEGQRVILRGPGERPIVRDGEKDPLSRAQYDVVKALLDAGERGLTKDGLDRQSKRGDARKILKRLAESDPDWKAVIHFPGKPGRGYRIG
jgi:hypothetical protein